jgi:hypothetical protein
MYPQPPAGAYPPAPLQPQQPYYHHPYQQQQPGYPNPNNPFNPQQQPQQQAQQPQQQPRRASTAAGGGEVNPVFICPITQDVMDDPVTAKDGYTYDRRAITEWLRNKSTSPMTNAPLPSKELLPNHPLRSAIMEARQKGQL